MHQEAQPDGRVNRNVNLLVAGTATSVFGSALTALVVLLEFSDKGSGVVAGALLAELLPMVLGAPLVGRLVDHYSNRRLMITAQTVQGGAVGLLAFSLDSVLLSYLALVMVGFGTAVVSPACSALVPRAAGEDHANRAYARLSMGRTIGTLTGAAAGGVLVDQLGATNALLIDAATFGCFAMATTLLTVDRIPDPTEATTLEQRGTRATGFRHIRTSRSLSVATAGLALMVLGTVLVNVAEVFWVKDVLHLGGTALGALTACWGLGALAGARLAGSLTTNRGLMLGLSTGGVAMGLGLILTGALPYLAANVIGWLIAGAANGAQNVTLQGVVRTNTPDPLRGRVFAAIGAAVMSANVTGTAIAGLAVGVIGPRATLLIAGTSTVIAGLLVLWATLTPKSSAHSRSDDGSLSDQDRSLTKP